MRTRGRGCGQGAGCPAPPGCWEGRRDGPCLPGDPPCDREAGGKGAPTPLGCGVGPGDGTGPAPLGCWEGQTGDPSPGTAGEGEGAGTQAPQTAGEGEGVGVAQQGQTVMPGGRQSGESQGAAWTAQAHPCWSQTAAVGSQPAGGEGVVGEGEEGGQRNPEVEHHARGCSSAIERHVLGWACLAWVIRSSWMGSGCHFLPPQNRSLQPEKTAISCNSPGCNSPLTIPPFRQQQKLFKKQENAISRTKKKKKKATCITLY